MPTCNTQTCLDYYCYVRGSGLIHGIRNFWIKAPNGMPASWPAFGEDSVKWGTDMWIGIDLINPAPDVLVVGTFTIKDCNQAITYLTSLTMPYGKNWRKWRFVGAFGVSCQYSFTAHSFGVGVMPETPPPL